MSLPPHSVLPKWSTSSSPFDVFSIRPPFCFPWASQTPFAPKQYCLRMRTIQNWPCNYSAFFGEKCDIPLLFFYFTDCCCCERSTCNSASLWISRNPCIQIDSNRWAGAKGEVFLFIFFFSPPPLPFYLSFFQQLFLRLARLRKWNFRCMCIKLPVGFRKYNKRFLCLPFHNFL